MMLPRTRVGANPQSSHFADIETNETKFNLRAARGIGLLEHPLYLSGPRKLEVMSSCTENLYTFAPIVDRSISVTQFARVMREEASRIRIPQLSKAVPFSPQKAQIALSQIPRSVLGRRLLSGRSSEHRESVLSMFKERKVKLAYNDNSVKYRTLSTRHLFCISQVTVPSILCDSVGETIDLTSKYLLSCSQLRSLARGQGKWVACLHSWADDGRKTVGEAARKMQELSQNDAWKRFRG